MPRVPRGSHHRGRRPSSSHPLLRLLESRRRQLGHRHTGPQERPTGFTQRAPRGPGPQGTQRGRQTGNGRRKQQADSSRAPNGLGTSRSCCWRWEGICARHPAPGAFWCHLFISSYIFPHFAGWLANIQPTLQPEALLSWLWRESLPPHPRSMGCAGGGRDLLLSMEVAKEGV